MLNPLWGVCSTSGSPETRPSFSQKGILGKGWPLEAQVSGTSAQGLMWTWNHWLQRFLHVSISWHTTDPCWFLTAIPELWWPTGSLGSLGTGPPEKHPTAMPGDKTWDYTYSILSSEDYFQYIVVNVSQTIKVVRQATTSLPYPPKVYPML